MAKLPNKLFSFANRRARESARRVWNNTPLAKAARQIRKGATGSASTRQIEQAISEVVSGKLSVQTLTTLASSNFSSLARDMLRYSAGGNNELQRAVDELLRALGPAGTLIRSLIKLRKADQPRQRKAVPGRGGQVEDELEAATALLRAFGHEVLPPMRGGTPAELATGVQAAAAFLDAHGELIDEGSKRGKGGGKKRRRGGRKDIPPDLPGDDAPANRPPTGDLGGGGSAPPRLPIDGEPPGDGGSPPGGGDSGSPNDPYVTVDTDEGPKRFLRTHPIVTRQLIRTKKSSNVYGFAYDVKTLTLYVRFLNTVKTGQGTARGGRGPLYGYRGVPHRVFLAFIEAPSAGTFVWDRLRIRGTVSGHQFDYSLVGISASAPYVPRKATLKPDGEYYVPRIFRGSSGRTYSSQAYETQVSRVVRSGMPPPGAN